MRQPFGRILLGIVAAGLLSFAVWRAVQVVFDPDHYGHEARGVVARLGKAISCMAHLALALAALTLVLGWGAGGNENSEQDWTRWLMNQPYGRWLVAGFGAGVVGAGLRSGIKGWRAKFLKRDRLAQSAPWTIPVAQFGLLARGFVFAIIGSFLIVAAIRANPGEARGLGGALAAIQEQPFGRIMLGVVALGLVAFGVYCFLEARYRRIGSPATG